MRTQSNALSPQDTCWDVGGRGEVGGARFTGSLWKAPASRQRLDSEEKKWTRGVLPALLLLGGSSGGVRDLDLGLKSYQTPIYLKRTIGGG